MEEYILDEANRYLNEYDSDTTDLSSDLDDKTDIEYYETLIEALCPLVQTVEHTIRGYAVYVDSAVINNLNELKDKGTDIPDADIESIKTLSTAFNDLITAMQTARSTNSYYKEVCGKKTKELKTDDK